MVVGLCVLMSGCVTDVVPPCGELIYILEGYEERAVDSLRAVVPPDSLWIKADSSVAFRYQPHDYCEGRQNDE